MPALRRRNSPNRKTAFSLQRGRYHPGLVRFQPSDIRRHLAGNGPAKPAPPFTRNLPASTLRFSSAHTRFLRKMSILPDLARIIPAPALHRDKPHPVFFQNTGCRKVSGSFFFFRAALRPAVPPEKRPMPTSRRLSLIHILPFFAGMDAVLADQTFKIVPAEKGGSHVYKQGLGLLGDALRCPGVKFLEAVNHLHIPQPTKDIGLGKSIPGDPVAVSYTHLSDWQQGFCGTFQPESFLAFTAWR